MKVLLMYKFTELVHRLGNNNDWDKIIPEIFLFSYEMYITILIILLLWVTGEKIGSREG